MEIGAHHRKVQIIGPDVSNNNTAKHLVTDANRRNQSTAPAPPPSPSGDGYGCNWLSGDYAYTVTVGDGNYINIQGNDPELTKVKNNEIYLIRKTAPKILLYWLRFYKISVNFIFYRQPTWCCGISFKEVLQNELNVSKNLNKIMCMLR